MGEPAKARAERLYYEGIRYYENGDFNKSIKTINDSIQTFQYFRNLTLRAILFLEHPTSPDLNNSNDWFQKADSVRTEGSTSSISNSPKGGITSDELIIFYAKWGTCLEEMRRYSQALKYYDLAINYLKQNRGTAHIKQDRVKGLNQRKFNCRKMMSMMSTLEEEHELTEGEVLAREAVILMEDNNFAEALRKLNVAVELMEHPQLYFHRGSCHKSLDNSEEADRDYQKVLELCQSGDVQLECMRGLVPESLFQLSLLALWAKNYKLALQRLNTALDIPNLAENSIIQLNIYKTRLLNIIKFIAKIDEISPREENRSREEIMEEREKADKSLRARYKLIGQRKYSGESEDIERENENGWCLVSLDWFRKWCKYQEYPHPMQENPPPELPQITSSYPNNIMYPGPIYNEELIQYIGVLQDPQSEFTNILLIDDLKEWKDYLFVSSNLFEYWKHIYGGHQINRSTITTYRQGKCSQVIEIKPKYFTVNFLPALDFLKAGGGILMVGMTDTLDDMKERVLRILKAWMDEANSISIQDVNLWVIKDPNIGINGLNNLFQEWYQAHTNERIDYITKNELLLKSRKPIKEELVNSADITEIKDKGKGNEILSPEINHQEQETHHMQNKENGVIVKLDSEKEETCEEDIKQNNQEKGVDDHEMHLEEKEEISQKYEETNTKAKINTEISIECENNTTRENTNTKEENNPDIDNKLEEAKPKEDLESKEIKNVGKSDKAIRDETKDVQNVEEEKDLVNESLVSNKNIKNMEEEAKVIVEKEMPPGEAKGKWKLDQFQISGIQLVDTKSKIIDQLESAKSELVIIEIKTSTTYDSLFKHYSPEKSSTYSSQGYSGEIGITQRINTTLQTTTASTDVYYPTQSNNIAPKDLPSDWIDLPFAPLVQEKGARRGATGLKNLGNSCYMNAAIQCLSAVLQLTKYFILDLHKSELNTENPLGMKGNLAFAYGELIKNIWLDNKSSTTPWQVKKIISHFDPQFAGYEQHDSQELLNYMLDGLHEDLNRVRKKPYMEEKDHDEEQNEVRDSEESWRYFKSRNNSIITDLFFGQLKSKIRCPKCNKMQVKYDPFMSLSLPIPTYRSVVVHFVPDWVLTPSTKITLSISSSSYLSELGDKILLHLHKRNSKLVFCNIMGGVIHRIFDMREVVHAGIEGNGQLYAYEYNANVDLNKCYPLEFRFQLKTKGWFKGNYNFPYPRLIMLNKQWTVHKFRLMLFHTLRPFLKEPKIKSGDIYIEESGLPSGSLIYDQIENDELEIDPHLLSAYDFYFKDKKTNPIYNIQISNNIPRKIDFFASGKHKCDFCQKVHTDNCTLSLINEGELTFTQIFGNMKYKRDLILILSWSKESEQNTNIKQLKSMFDKPNILNLVKNIPNEQLNRTKISIEDSLRNFCEEEQLDSENAWTCPNCEEQVEAFKKIEIVRLPKILILHFKRFRHGKSLGLFSHRKMTEFIKYPENNLDLGKYMINSRSERWKGVKYNLVGVVNHLGNMGSGHYIATTWNPLFNHWIFYNDSEVCKAEDDDVISPNAYILFYSTDHITLPTSNP